MTDLMPRHTLLSELAMASGVPTRTWLLLLDIDRMRAINERGGQAGGDRVLRAAAAEVRRLVAAARPGAGERIARYDGDAILIACTGSRSEIAALAESLRRGISARPIAGLDITCSIAASAWRIGESLDTALARVEQTLHLAKQFGRDCVEIAATPPQHDTAAEVRYLGRGPRPGS